MTRVFLLSSGVASPPSSDAASPPPPKQAKLPIPACFATPNRTATGASPYDSAPAPPCSSTTSTGFIVGGLMSIVVGIVISIAILFHFYRRARRGGRVANEQQGTSAAGGLSSGPGQRRTTPIPIAVQSIDAEGSVKGDQPGQPGYTATVCVRLPGPESGLVVAWPEQGASKQHSTSAAASPATEGLQSRQHLGLPVTADAAPEQASSGRTLLSNLFFGRRGHRSSPGDTKEEDPQINEATEGGPSPDSTVHSARNFDPVLHGVLLVVGATEDADQLPLSSSISGSEETRIASS